MDSVFAGTEKREHRRMTFAKDRRPLLLIGAQEFEVVDISRKGIRLANDRPVASKGWINGTLKFPDHQSVEIDGIVVRQKDGNMGIHLVSSLDMV
jgi:hypothetical protein